ncbi:MAG TPA: universal stress protein [Steroidobacteraceae bacterium]
MRALNDSIALIEKADRTWLLNVDSGRDTLPVQSLERVTERLRRHGGSVDFMQLPASGRSVAGVLPAKAQDLGADLIVCGAFGNSRLKENLFGGVTRDLLDPARLPLLLSH